MPRMALTDRFLAGLKPKVRTVFFDTKSRGLALRASPAGSKKWLFVYRAPGKAPQWITLGTYPDLALVDARAAALEQRHAVNVQKRDPAAERREARSRADATSEPSPPPPSQPKVFIFSDLAKLYETFARGRKKSWKADVAMTTRYLIPAWGDLPLRSITRAHVHELLDTLVAKGMTIGVNRVQSVISRLFTIALDRSLVDAHPVARMIKRFQERASDRVLNDEELRALWAGLDQRSGRASDALRLRLLLGQRGGEVSGMQWAEVDLAAKTWQLPGARTKNGRPHVVPLPPTTLAVLERLRAETPKEEPNVFPGVTAWTDDYRDLSAIHGGTYMWKDLRRTVGTRIAALGFSEDVVGRALNHARYTVTAKHYIKHSYLAEVRRALEAWDAELVAVVSGHPAEKGTVVPFQR